MKMSRILKRNHSIVENTFNRSSLAFIFNTTVWVTLVDGVVIGNYLGVDAVAAYGLVWPVVLVYGLLTAVFSGGTRTMYSQLVGKGRIEEANRVFSTACVSSIVISIIVIAFSLFFSETIAAVLGATGANAHLAPLVSSYIRGFVFEVPFFCLGGIISAIAVIDSDFKRAGYARLAMSLFDIFGDLAVVLLMNGGMFLLGFTTAIAQFVYFLVICTHFFQKDRILRFVFPNVRELAPTLGSIVANGAPAGITSASGALGGIMINRILAFSATSTFIAAYSVHKSVGSMMGVAYMCVADSVWTLSGIYYGEQDKRALDELQRTAVRKGLLYNCTAALVLFIFARYFALLFIGNVDGETLALASEAVRLLALSLPVYVLVYSFKSYLMGTGRKRTADIYSVLLECVVHVTAAAAMVSLLGGRGAWFATPLRLLVMLGIALGYIRLYKTGNTFDEKRLLLPDGFDSGNCKELSMSLSSEEELVGAIAETMSFCEKNGIIDKKKNALVHCLEEAGSNVISHGFRDKTGSMDIRILIKNEDVILRIRDDCKGFNPIDYYEITKKNKEHIEQTGLKIIMGMSSESQYINTVGTNNFIIHI